jgi:Spy/CpxP family protein refolding chaperone
MRKNLIAGLALCSALALGSVPAMAAPQAGPHAGWSHHGGKHGMKMLEQLNLTAEQKASVKQIMKSHFEQNKGQWQQLRQQRRAFEAMKPTDSDYQSAAASLADAEGKAAIARVQQMANVRADIYKVLTPEQQTKLESLKAERMAKHEAKRKKWRDSHMQRQAPATDAAPKAQ